MKSFYKAIVATAIILFFGYLISAQMDSTRVDSLKREVEGVMFESQARAVIGYYGRVMTSDPEEQCKYLLSLRQKQLERAYSLAFKIQDYERRNLFDNEYMSLKTAYMISLADSYISGFENRKLCGSKEVPLVFFYREIPYCPECIAQDTVLQNVGSRCSGARIYAFPYDSRLEPVQLLSDRYDVRQAPTIIIDEEWRKEGIASESEIVSELVKRGASCS